MTIFLRVALISIIPGLSFLPETSSLISRCIYSPPTPEQIETVRYASYIFGSIAILSFNYKAQNYKNNIQKSLKELNQVHRLNLDSLLKKLSDGLEIKNEFKIRVFKVKKKYFGGDLKTLENLQIDLITDMLLVKTPLKFKVGAERVEGVVGVCYRERTFFADFDTNDANRYVLTQEQINKIGDVSFCCALPIINNTNVKYVVSLDSPKSIEETEVNKKILLKYLKEICTLFDAYILK